MPTRQIMAIIIILLCSALWAQDEFTSADSIVSDSESVTTQSSAIAEDVTNSDSVVPERPAIADDISDSNSTTEAEESSAETADSIIPEAVDSFIVVHKIKPGLLMSANGEPIRVLSSFSDTVGVVMEAEDTVAYYGETEEAYFVVENGEYPSADSIETLGIMPKHLVRIVALPETLTTKELVVVDAAPADAVKTPVVSNAPISMKDKIILFVKQNKKPVAIGGGAALALIILVAALSGGDDSGGPGGGGGGGEPIIEPISIAPPN